MLTTYLGLKKAQVVNQQIVQHRIRLLQTFIDFIQSHPSLSKDAVFIRFISEDPSWVQLGVLPNCLLYASGKAEAVYSESPEQSAAKSAEAVNPKHAEVFERVGSLQDILEGLEKSQGKIHKGYKGKPR